MMSNWKVNILFTPLRSTYLFYSIVQDEDQDVDEDLEVYVEADDDE